MARDIAADTLAVGNALSSVRIDQMILNLAKGIAWGQYELDKVGVDITKMMGVPGVVSIGGENLSMLEAGFLPSFYHFVDTILELKMEVNIREESSASLALKEQLNYSTSVEAGGEVGMKASGSAGFGPFSASAEVSAKAHWKTSTTAGYSRAVDAAHSQKFSQDLSATSSMRTKIVPVPPPDLLVERIKILLDRLRKEAETEEVEQIIFTIDGEAPTAEALIAALQSEPARTKLGKAENVRVTIVSELAAFASQWTFDAEFDGKDRQSFLAIANTSTKKINGYAGQKKSLDQLLMAKIEERLLERLPG
jgi:hypothetical protein